MANSIITYTGDGSTVQYPLNFTLGILKREYVTCRVGNEVDGSNQPVYRTLEWVTDGLVNIQGAVPGNGIAIVFSRTIPKDSLIHDYSDGVPIIEKNLDESNLQSLMAIHEFLDGRLEGGFVQDMNMNGFKIINLGPGVADTDAANMSQINAVIGDATDQADRSRDWATKTNGLVESIDNSSKAYAIGGTGVTNTSGKGAAKEWATKTGATVDTAEYSAKEYAQGAVTAHGGSAKRWATTTGTAAASGEYSAKEYALGDLTATGGSAKAWAVDAASPNGTTDLSAKSYAALTAADRVQTGLDRTQTGADVVAATAMRDQAVAAANNMKYRSVRAATVGNLSIANYIPGYSLDDVVLATGDRILIKNHAAPANCGLYVVQASGVPLRASDADTWGELVASLVVVEEGTANGDTTFLCTVNQGGTLGTTAVTYVNWQAYIPDASINLTTKVTGVLPIANGGTGGSTDIAARSALSAAGRTQTSLISFVVKAPGVEMFRPVINSPVAFTVLRITTRCISGTATVISRKNGSNMTSGTNSVSTTEQTVTPSGANTVFAVGDDLELNVTASASCTLMTVTYAIQVQLDT